MLIPCDDIIIDQDFLDKRWKTYCRVNNFEEHVNTPFGLNTVNCKGNKITDKIYIHLKNMFVFAECNEVNYYELICETIIHEYMHRLLRWEYGDLYSKQWDNIADGVVEWKLMEQKKKK